MSARPRRVVRLTMSEATVIDAALNAWIGHLEAGGRDADDDEAVQLANAQAARRLIVAAIVRALPMPGEAAAR